MKTVLSYSGGLDSTVLLYKLLREGDEVHCLHFDYGSKHHAKEYESAMAICRSLNVPLTKVSLPFINELFTSNLLTSGGAIPEGHYSDPSMRQTVVPGRNTIFLSILIGYAESIKAQRVALANHAGDHATYPDCRPEWVASMSLVAYHGTYDHVRLYAPFTHLDKGDLCAEGAVLGVPFEKTWTCYNSKEKHCGVCGSCVARKEAFLKARVMDPTPWL